MNFIKFRMFCVFLSDLSLIRVAELVRVQGSYKPRFTSSHPGPLSENTSSVTALNYAKIVTKCPSPTKST